MKDVLLAIDQGTTGTTALVIAFDGKTLARATVEFPQHFPKPGWVEHDSKEIWKSVGEAVTNALKNSSIDASRIAGIGITNQRETTLVWERASGEPIHNAIVWQCRRTADACDALKKSGASETVFKKTGLVIDAYFSGTKIAWLLDNVEGARKKASDGKLAFGTIDTFLIHSLSGGEAHVTDVTNASRTMLMNLSSLAWDEDLAKLLHVPTSMLPQIKGSAEVVAHTKNCGFLPDGIAICGIAGDQQAALFGQACFEEGDAKCTYGTGAFALVNIGQTPRFSTHGLLTTVAWKIGDKTTYAIEGSAFIAGAAVQWLRDGLGIIKTAKDIEALARTVESSHGVAFVPALSGLGAPYWDQGARGTITGITRGTTAAHIARATLEGIAFEVTDLLSAMIADAGRPIARLRVDGGAAANDLLIQFQSDVANVKVDRPFELESTGRGAAMLAGVGAGVCDLDAARKMLKIQTEFAPKMTDSERTAHLARWTDAVRRSRS